MNQTEREAVAKELFYSMAESQGGGFKEWENLTAFLRSAWLRVADAAIAILTATELLAKKVDTAEKKWRGANLADAPTPAPDLSNERLKYLLAKVQVSDFEHDYGRARPSDAGILVLARPLAEALLASRERERKLVEALSHRAEFSTLVKLAEAVALSGVEETDPRIDWVNLQVDRVFLAALRAEIKRVKGGA